mmetsp:Transcript_41566/g.88560  ORF Transcript_41566/g.88560 Transcript_41566/m.88560 type:complete len:459 (-) Transcript_41566:674-2050(-)
MPGPDATARSERANISRGVFSFHRTLAHVHRVRLGRERVRRLAPQARVGARRRVVPSLVPPSLVVPLGHALLVVHHLGDQRPLVAPHGRVRRDVERDHALRTRLAPPQRLVRGRILVPLDPFDELRLGPQRVTQQQLAHHLGDVGTDRHGDARIVLVLHQARTVKVLTPGQVVGPLLGVHPHLLRHALAVDPAHPRILQLRQQSRDLGQVRLVLDRVHEPPPRAEGEVSQEQRSLPVRREPPHERVDVVGELELHRAQSHHQEQHVGPVRLVLLEYLLPHQRGVLYERRPGLLHQLLVVTLDEARLGRVLEGIHAKVLVGHLQVPLGHARPPPALADDGRLPQLLLLLLQHHVHQTQKDAALDAPPQNEDGPLLGDGFDGVPVERLELAVHVALGEEGPARPHALLQVEFGTQPVPLPAGVNILPVLRLARGHGAYALVQRRHSRSRHPLPHQYRKGL